MLKLNKNKNIIAEQVDQEYILFDSEKNTIFVLNKTAYELWERCADKSKEEVIKKFVEILDMASIEMIGLNSIQIECEHIIDDFIANGLVEV